MYREITTVITSRISNIPLGTNTIIEYTPTEQEEKLNQLNLNLKEAIEIEDYNTAASLQREINLLTN